MPNLGSSAPYYGGGQVPNPANVTQIYTEPPEFKAALGSLAVMSKRERVYMAVSESGPGNGTVWTQLTTATTPQSVFPITPYVVGPNVGQAGYATIQSAINAANAAGGGTVYIQTGVYTENLTWPLGVYLAAVEPTSFYGVSTVRGVHTIVPGNSPDLQFGASQIFFSGAGNLFSGSIASIVSCGMVDCIFQVTSPTGFVFNLPSIQADVRSVFEMSNCAVVGGGAFALPGGTINVFNSTLAFSNQSMAVVGGSYNFEGSTIADPIVISSGNLFARNCVFNNSIVLQTTSSPSILLISCSIFSDTAACLTFNGTSGGQLVDCSLDSVNTNAIDGTSSGNVLINGVFFQESALINAALTVVWSSAAVGGALVATNSVATFAGATAYTNATTAATINAIGVPDHWKTVYEGATPFYMPVWAAVP